ncbi:MAG: ABC-F family ATP-binding cassette domain-containing protein [Leptospiraceae bacterium]|nr:ABC-F family ATP-binding cassette domain-containing protein [Leptospiraceae bacterium]MCP5499394.1 ABC-F family ATP-binding cassette domain-containing protein [Leptospiraceae bacterium]
MIKMNGINKSFGGQTVFSDLNFSINRGEKVGLVGRNGHGKSTLLEMILGRVEPDSGNISIPKNYKIGHLEQHLKFSKPTVLEECSLGLPPGEEYETWQVEMILSGLGFSEADMQRHPDEFSGGYQIRMNLAKLLVSAPDMLMLDEPNNYLDIVTIRWLEEFLRSWEGEFILITHDRNFMDSVVSHVIAIHREKAIKVAGDTDKLYNQINTEEENYEKTRLNEAKKRKQEEQFIARFKAKASFASRAQSRVKKLEKMGEKKALDKIEDLELFFNSAKFEASRMLSAENISFSYDGKEPYLIRDFSLTIERKERICIIGKNGKGKSTLLKLLAGELKPDNGNIYKHPILLEGYFGQTNKKVMNDDNTIYEEIKASDPDCTDYKARTIAGGLMFPDTMSLKKIKVLSGGEKSRVLLGKILVSPCHLLFLDEPTSHLDMQSCDSLIEAIDDFEGSVVMVTHDEMHLRAVATKLIVFDNNEIRIYPGTYDEFLSDVGWSDESI